MLMTVAQYCDRLRRALPLGHAGTCPSAAVPHVPFIIRVIPLVGLSAADMALGSAPAIALFVSGLLFGGVVAKSLAGIYYRYSA